MFPRRLLASILLFGLASPLLGQQVPFQNSYGQTMLAGNAVIADPYATVPLPSVAPVFGTIALPSGESLRDRVWFRVEYLRMRAEGMDLPPLITTSPVGTPIADAGALGTTDVAVLFGANDINGGGVSGFKYISGFRSRRNPAVSFESEYFKLKSQSDGFFGQNDGSGILALPYFNIVAGAEDARLLSYPGNVAGNVGVSTKTKFSSYMTVLRAGLCPTMVCTPGAQSDSVDGIIGYRYLELTDRIQLSHNLTSLVPSDPDSISVVEQFDTKNKFNGLQLGTIYRANFRRAWLDTSVRVGVGSNRQQVRVFGSAVNTEAGVSTSFPTGFMTQRTNIATIKKNKFTMIPEVGMTLGFRFTQRFHGTIGYSVVYFPNVVRAGDQIDRDLNPTLFAPETAFVGAARPRFRFEDTSYYAHGLNIGGEFRF